MFQLSVIQNNSFVFLHGMKVSTKVSFHPDGEKCIVFLTIT